MANTRIRTLDFLPDIFKTDVNSQFLRGTLDQLVDQPELTKIEGYIGREFSSRSNSSTFKSHVVENSALRNNYQLEPGVVFTKPSTTSAKDFITYPEMVDTIGVNGGINNNHDRLFTSDTYSWDPFINLDMLVNFNQYYWLENGPTAVAVTGTTVNSINVANDIVSKKQYTSPNNVVFTNGLKVTFSGTVTPSAYIDVEYYVQGVGISIELVPVSEILATEVFTLEKTLAWDTVSWDSNNWEIRKFVPQTKDYITIARNSVDRNAWSRSNMWFHIDVIRSTAAYNNTVDYVDEVATYDNKAQRPIIEFYPNLSLFNHGTTSKGVVDFYTTVYSKSQIDNWDTRPVMSGGLGPCTVDGTELFDGSTIVFTNDSDVDVRRKIYRVSIDDVTSVITLIFDKQCSDGDGIFIRYGTKYEGADFYFSANAWKSPQQKSTINQAPLFDVFNSSGVSYGDSTYYLQSTFVGCTLFEYGKGTGTTDNILGFPILYTAVYNASDITYNVTYNSDIFEYAKTTATTTVMVNAGYVHSLTPSINTSNVSGTTVTGYTRLNGWRKSLAPSVQYQVFEFDNLHQTYTCDVLVADSTQTVINTVESTKTSWATIQVYINGIIQTKDTNYTVTSDSTKNTTTVTINDSTLKLFSSPATTLVQVLIYSNQVSGTAYYQIPTNLSSNPLNSDITVMTTGELRQQYTNICQNSISSVTNSLSGLPSGSVVGAILGSNNYRDIGMTVPLNNKLVKNSASMAMVGAMLRNGDNDINKALQFNSTEYSLYKTLLISTVQNTDYSSIQTTSSMLDDAIDIISGTKSQSGSFFYSDMLPNKIAYASNSYPYNTSTLNTFDYPLTRIYDYTVSNYYGVLVYVERVINGVTRQTLLVKDVDYVIMNNSALVKLLPGSSARSTLVNNDVISVYEYNQTYGSYVPNTPTKLGMYPSFVPEVVSDSKYRAGTVYFIRGHDGSLTKLYGDYITSDSSLITDSQRLVDFRDRVLLEFETRIYNNLKLVGLTMPFTPTDVVPSFERLLRYSHSEFTNIRSGSFLNWVGQNRIDYKNQTYYADDSFTYNYHNVANKVDGSVLNVGYWRGIYEYLYDTSTPDVTPWEMIGYIDKPSWWDTRYGTAPYTSDNLLMWRDMRDGYDYNGNLPRVLPQYIRPRLLQYLPVDSDGILLSPLFVISNDLSTVRSLKSDWSVGDIGPAEYTYLNSSNWPFDVVRLFALMYPAKFYSTCCDLDHYRYNSEFDQYQYDSRYLNSDRSAHDDLTPDKIVVYGSGNSSTSYINWIVDYQKRLGMDATSNLTSYLKNLDVRLVYRVAGFTDKDLIKFYIEKGRPNNNLRRSLSIPEESYSILLHDNQPQALIAYSSVIVQRTSSGYRVYGNSQSVTYFKTLTPKLSQAYTTISVENLSVEVPTEFTGTTMANGVIMVPYGTEFFNVQDLATFLVSYGGYLTSQGMKFNEVANGIEVTWNQMVAEFLYWSQSGWEVGSTVNINPAATSLVIEGNSVIVQPLTNSDRNFILNQNLYPVQLSDMAVTRVDTQFGVKILNASDSVSYGEFNMHSIEHGIVFDNSTLFGDTLYNLTTGLRQNRLLLRGSKTASWNGTIDTAGFILNQDNVIDWASDTRYSPGTIVKHKNLYYISTKLVASKATFDDTDWHITDYDQIRKGLLPNSSTRSAEMVYYGDTSRANLSNDSDVLGFSLIGYRPRDYLDIADLTNITQVNVYQSIVKEKGTLPGARLLSGAQFSQGDLQYTVYENFALLSGEYGGVMSSNAIELLLDESELKSNPSIVEVYDTVTSPTNDLDDGIDIQSINVEDVYKYVRKPTSARMLPSFTVASDLIQSPNSSMVAPLPDCGFVNFNDVKTHSYFYFGLPNATYPLSSVYVRHSVWIADNRGTWDVLSPIALTTLNQYSPTIETPEVSPSNWGIYVTKVFNNQNGTAIMQCSGQHHMPLYTRIAIVGFSDTIDGYYTVMNTLDNQSFAVNVSLDSSVSTLTGTGIILVFLSQRCATPGDIKSLPLPPLSHEFVSDTVYVDSNSTVSTIDDTERGWAVYKKNVNYSVGARLLDSNSATMGGTVAYDPNIGYLVSKTSSVSTDPSVVLQYNTSNVLVNTFIGTGNTFGTHIEYNTVKRYVLISEPDISRVFVYNVNSATPTTPIQTINASVAQMTLSLDGNYLFIVPTTLNSGFVAYKFNSVTNTYVLDVSPTLPLALTYTNIATDNTGICIVATNKFDDTGDIYHRLSDVAGTNYYQLVQTVTPGTTQQTPMNYGTSVDVNRLGSEFIVGSPTMQVRNVNGSVNEGLVYRYSHRGKSLGVIKGTKPVSVTTGGNFVITTGSGSTTITVLATDTASTIALKINDSSNGAYNVLATVDSTNTLTLAVKDKKLSNANSLLTIDDDVTNLSVPSICEQLGITLYTLSQTIDSPHVTDYNSFGFQLKFDKHASSVNPGFVVSALTGNRRSLTTFDSIGTTLDDLDKTTVFDNNGTQFVESIPNLGTVYMYDYLKSSSGTLGVYTLGQSLGDTTDIGITNQPTLPHYGTSLDYSMGTVIIGAPLSVNVGTSDIGRAIVYTSNSGSCWQVSRELIPSNVVDTSRLSNLMIYDKRDNSNHTVVDLLDPLRGRLLGVVHENLDYISSVDPASYNTDVNLNGTGSSGLSWGNEHVGQLWFNTLNTRFVNYHQNDIVYDSKYWGTVFPGSDVQVYTWIESTVPPQQYVGPGTPLDSSENTSIYTVGYMTTVNNELATVYYYWVQNTGKIIQSTSRGTTGGNETNANSLKTLTDTVIQAYISDPQSTGISYLTPTKPNTVSVYNSSEYIIGQYSVLHLGYGAKMDSDVGHRSFNLIKDGDSTGWITDSQYETLIDSLCGVTVNGKAVPDYTLPLSMRVGVNKSMGQSYFRSRLTAVKNLVQYANSVLSTMPVFEITEPTFLFYTGVNGTVSFDVSQYWTYTNYWVTGYSDNVRPVSQVATYNNLSLIDTSRLSDGSVVKVLDNGIGKNEWYVYTASTSSWSRIGLQRGTLQFNSSLYDVGDPTRVGWDQIYWDQDIFDAYPELRGPTTELRWILRSLFEEIFVGDMLVQRNKTLTLLFKYILSESSSDHVNDWLTKTSFVDITHTVRDLIPLDTYENDNQTLLEGYINEIKPYHVVIKEFLFKYNANDSVNVGTTDFDLPPKFNPGTNTYITPMLNYTGASDNENDNQFLPNDSIWSTSDYRDWKENWGLKLDDVVLVYNGRGYNSAPIVTVSSPSSMIAPRTVAKLSATVGNGSVTGLTIVDHGDGYPLNPIIDIEPAVVTTTPTYNVDSINIIDSVNNTVTVYSTNIADTLVTGDLVRYTVTGPTGINGLVNNSLYYVRVVSDTVSGWDVSGWSLTVWDNDLIPDTVRISLYANFTDMTLDQNRVVLGSMIGSTSSTVVQFSVGAIACSVPKNDLVRGNVMTLRYDRTTYQPQAKVYSQNAWSLLVQKGWNLLPWSSQYLIGEKVLYGGKFYRCTRDTNDVNYGTTFNVSYWTVMPDDSTELNHIDRIIARYEPTLSMPGLDLSQLVPGVTNPLPSYRGSPMTGSLANTPVETLLSSKRFEDQSILVTGATIANDRYMAVADNDQHGLVLTSSNAIDYTLTKIGQLPLGLTGISYGPLMATAKYVVTTNSLRRRSPGISSANNPVPLLFSTDGLIWSSVGQVTPTTSITLLPGFKVSHLRLNAIHHDNGTYCAVGDNGVILISVDGLNWTQQTEAPSVATPNPITSPTTNNLNAVTYDSARNLWITVGDRGTLGGTVVTGLVNSTNGTIEWRLRSTGVNCNLYSVTVGHGSPSTLVSVGSNTTIIRSLDGVNWGGAVYPVFAPTVPVNTSTTLKSVSFNSSIGAYVAVGELFDTTTTTPTSISGAIWTSGDGINWNNQANQSNWSISSWDISGWSDTTTFKPINLVISGTSTTSTLDSEFTMFGNNSLVIHTSDVPNDPDPLAPPQSKVIGKMYSVAKYNPDTSITEDDIKVQGSPFLFGYGPDELVPAKITEHVAINVKSLTGTSTAPDIILSRGTTGTYPITVNANQLNRITTSAQFVATTNSPGVMVTGTDSRYTTVRSTSSADNSVIVDDITLFNSGDTVYFQGTTLGGLQSWSTTNTTYTVSSVNTRSKTLYLVTLGSTPTDPAIPVVLTDSIASDNTATVVVKRGTNTHFSTLTPTIVTLNGINMTRGIHGIITDSNSATNQLTMVSQPDSTQFAVNDPIVFGDNVGSLSKNTVYYVKFINASTLNQFSVSLTPGGAQLPLTTWNGITDCVTHDYALAPVNTMTTLPSVPSTDIVLQSSTINLTVGNDIVFWSIMGGPVSTSQTVVPSINAPDEISFTIDYNLDKFNVRRHNSNRSTWTTVTITDVGPSSGSPNKITVNDLGNLSTEDNSTVTVTSADQLLSVTGSDVTGYAINLPALWDYSDVAGTVLKVNAVTVSPLNYTFKAPTSLSTINMPHIEYRHTSFVGRISGTFGSVTMTVNSVLSGEITVGQRIMASNIPTTTDITVTGLLSGTGNIGTYTVQISGVPLTSSLVLTDLYGCSIVDGTIDPTSTRQTVNVTVYMGNTMVVGSEEIKYAIDNDTNYTANTVTVVYRGYNNTSWMNHDIGSLCYSVRASDTMSDNSWGKHWTQLDQLPLSASADSSAVFLRG